MIKAVFSNIILIPIAIALILPLWIMFIASLQIGDNPLDFGYIIPDFSELTFKHFITIWKEGNFSRYFFNSALVTFFITCGNLIFDSMVAYALARRKFFAKNLLWALIGVKLMIPAAVLLVPTFTLIKFLNLYDSYPALILPLLTETFGIYILTQYIKNIPLSFEESASMEGASDVRIFISIILPIIRPALAIVGIHSVLTSWNMYIYPLILTSSNSMRTLPLGINFYALSHPEATIGELMATNVITALPVLIIFIFFQRKIISALTQGALKG